MIELALALPILLIVLIGIIDFGRAINYWNDETNLANLGARYASVGALSDSSSTCAGSSSQLVAYIKCEAGQASPELQNGVTPGQNGVQNIGGNGGIAVCVNAPNGDTPGSPITVRVSASYVMLPLPKVLGNSSSGVTLNLAGTATMRIEQSASQGGLDITTGSTGTC
ncbi:MAG TPA: TadE/TadG family type IV pilus assembly protein [Caulobacteraceae bacterium]|nr:TadE/TadG family type IV pilus assembly protein [Caulobacteraceae bacterium]